MIKRCVMFLVLFGSHISAMDVVPNEREFVLHGSDYDSINDLNKNKITWDLLQLSPTLKVMIEDLDYSNEHAIPIDSVSSKVLSRLIEILKSYREKDIFNSLDKQKARVYKMAQAYSLAELIEITNAANYLGIDENILEAFANVMIDLMKKDDFEQGNYGVLRDLNVDFAKKYIVSFVKKEIIGYIKARILIKHGNDRKTFFEHSLGLQVMDYPLQAGKFFNNSDKMVVENPSAVLGIYDTLNYKKETDISGNEDGLGVYSIATYEDQLIAAGLTNNKIFVWNLSDRNNIRMCKLKGSHSSTTKLSFSFDGKYLVGASDSDNARFQYKDRLYMWNLTTIDWSKTKSIKGSLFDRVVDYSIQDIFFIPNSHKFRAVLFEPHLTIMKIVSFNITKEGVLEIENEEIIIKEDIAEFSYSEHVVFNNDGSKIAFTLAGNIVIWDTINNSLIKEWKLVNKVLSIRFSADDRWIACGELNKITLYDSLSGQLLTDLDTLYKNIAIDFSRDGKKLLSVGSSRNDSKKIGIWILLTDKESNGLEEFAKNPIDIAFLVQLYRAMLLHNPVEISPYELSRNIYGLSENIKDLFNDVGLIVEVLSPYEPIIEDVSPTDESDYIKLLGMKKNVLISKKTPSRLQQWWQWFKNKTFGKFFYGSASKTVSSSYDPVIEDFSPSDEFDYIK